ncbi:uncharacterized protein SPPG_05345 [Spizellomyces punctatus DAOM BR117]|uniref:ABC transporter domain-containing protein n=1 Tax=Spizellomyces punctatus (strain DAOM BR117) TaxID=645134 RepID=A0A0L0HET1_SPIPD|nr:uncharacterized protein SPPG_05345 [Spizellomyces punctatus DAOM BR117]KNC99970.1 hypothetical protein SPPG_05345 [Spizellomyces punctatus DAOM BR117]|eukprot:XP_016608010.1 hypothetical protein SPPG_05345 [Spizellomyces punctatus DAOM BR117]
MAVRGPDDDTKGWVSHHFPLGGPNASSQSLAFVRVRMPTLFILFSCIAFLATGMSAQPSATPNTTVSQVVTVTVTATPSPQPSTCPVCFNCNTQGCKNFGTCKGAVCSCIDGFGGQDCSETTCGSPNQAPENRAIRAANSTCQCDDGFTGVNCNVCTRNDVCKGKPGSPAGQTLVCNKDSVTWKESHSYCEVTEPLLKTVYPLDSYVTFDRNLGTGEAYGILWYTGIEQFACKATDCSQDRLADTMKFKCSTLKCNCDPKAAFCGGPGKSIDLSGPVNGASGGLEYTCPRSSNGTGDCHLKFEFLAGIFPSGIRLSNCMHGECALPSDDPGDPSSESAGKLTTGAIAAVSTFGGILAVFACALVFACIKRAKAKTLPVPPTRKGVTITYRNLNYSVGKKRILSDIGGEVHAGRALAVMGPSGAGKSSFLDILAAKSKRGELEGSLLVDGSRISRMQYRRLIGYVDQDDCLMETLTVRETLMFSANLRLPESMTRQAKRDRVEEVISLLGLSHVADSKVGGQTRRGISGGERRRVSIGVELVTSPAVLFLDEPTSGLDSYNAHAVMRTICDLAHKSKKTIIFTIHQPRSDVYAMFDDILLLRNGEIMYSGASKDMEKYFASLGHPCPPGYNIADWVLDLASGSGETGAEMKEVNVREVYGSDDWEMRIRRGSRISKQSTGNVTVENPNAQIKRASSSAILLQDLDGSHNRDYEEVAYENMYSLGDRNSVSSNGSRDADARVGSAKGAYTVSFLTQSGALMARNWKNLWRRPTLWATHMGIAIVLGAFVGGLYWRSDTSLGGIQNRLGSIFFLMSLLGFSGLSAIGTLNQERQLFVRERANGFYGPLPFFLSKIIFDLIPLRIIPAVIMGSIAFFMVGYTSDADHFIRFIGVLSLFAANCGLFCMAVACAVKDIGTASLVGSIALLFQMLFAGFLLNQNQIPTPLRWIQYLSLFRYAYEALVVNDISGLTIVDNVSGLGVNVPASIILDKFGFDRGAFVRDAMIEVAWFAGFLALIAILIVLHVRETR